MAKTLLIRWLLHQSLLDYKQSGIHANAQVNELAITVA